VSVLAPQVENTLKGLRTESRGLDLVQRQVDDLLPLKNRIDELRKRVKEIKRAINEVLNSDEDMSMMFLKHRDFDSCSDTLIENDSDISTQNGIISDTKTATKSISKTDNDMNRMLDSVSDVDSTTYTKSRTKSVIVTSDFNPTNIIKSLKSTRDTNTENSKQLHKFHDKSHGHKKDRSEIIFIETLFETYLNEIEWISADIEEFLDEITNTEENVVLQLDILRNRILRFELTLSICSFVGTCGAFISGLFGMNLISHVETNHWSFYIVTVLTTLGCTLMFYWLRAFAVREKLF
jgi:Mg2+ and Co2+ transporter CorA